MNKASMKVQVNFFASIREQVGKSQCDVDLNIGTTVSELWSEFKECADLKHTLCAVNHEYTRTDHVLQNGDEVAFFPPVTGG
jgi:molybdopterin synthase sulfur carrier subunit